MFGFVRSLSSRQLLTEQAPTLAVSLAIAEIAYKFHSFLLEASAFLLTWYVLDAARHALGVRLWPGSTSTSDARQ
jgi:hypothetical protein